MNKWQHDNLHEGEPRDRTLAAPRRRMVADWRIYAAFTLGLFAGAGLVAWDLIVRTMDVAAVVAGIGRMM